MSDELIMLYADGVLPADQRPAARALLASDAGAMERFEAYLFTRGPVARAFDDALSAPIPERLMRVVRETPMAQPRPTASPQRRSGLARLADLLRMPALSPAVALPAVLVAAAGGWLASQALRSDFVPLERRGFVAPAALQQALERTPSSASAGIVDGVTFKPTLTFASMQQTWCREFELNYGTALRDGGLACRTRDGAWRVIAATGPRPLPASSPPNVYVPAGNDDLLDKARGEIRGGPALRGDEVRLLIEKGWSANP